MVTTQQIFHDFPTPTTRSGGKFHEGQVSEVHPPRSARRCGTSEGFAWRLGIRSLGIRASHHGRGLLPVMQGVIRLPIFGGNQIWWKCTVNLKDFACNNVIVHCLGWQCNGPCYFFSFWMKENSVFAWYEEGAARFYGRTSDNFWCCHRSHCLQKGSTFN